MKGPRTINLQHTVVQNIMDPSKYLTLPRFRMEVPTRLTRSGTKLHRCSSDHSLFQAAACRPSYLRQPDPSDTLCRHLSKEFFISGPDIYNTMLLCCKILHIYPAHRKLFSSAFKEFSICKFSPVYIPE